MTSADTRARRSPEISGRHARRRLRLVEQLTSSVHVVVLDARGRLVDANAAALDAVNATLEDVHGLFYEDTPWWRCAETHQRVRDGLEAARNGHACQVGVTIRHEHLGPRQIELTVQPVGRGDDAMLVCAAVDVTEHQRQLALLRTTRVAVDHLAGPVFQIASDGHITYANGAALRQLGYRREELLGAPLSRLDPGITADTWPELWRQCREQRNRMWVRRHRHKDGRLLPARQRVSWFSHQGEEFLVIHAEELPVGVALVDGTGPVRDPVTGLPDRRHLLARINESLARADDGLALLAVGIDRFQLVTDILGPEQADDLLRAVAGRIRALGGERVVARLETDEFAVLVEGGHQDCAALMRDIGHAFSRPLELGGREFYITCSLGMAGVCEGDTAEALVRHAWNALYQARANGRNNYSIWHSQTGNCDSDELAMELALYRAIQQDELVLHYQPCIETATGKAASFEALVRWQHPDKGLLAPGRFVPLAEQSDLIIALGDWIVRAACRQYRAWQRDGSQPRRIRVNLSPRQFRHRDLLQRVVNILDDTGVPATALEFELTEGMLMDDIDYSMSVMEKMRELGMRVSLDDFGMGYSCLSQLRNCPLDSIKIDKSFVCDIARDDTALAIVETILSMGHRLGLTVVAEGVETRDQYDLLRSIGCDQIQGFFFAEPLPADVATKLLRKRRRLIPA